MKKIYVSVLIFILTSILLFSLSIIPSKLLRTKEVLACNYTPTPVHDIAVQIAAKVCEKPYYTEGDIVAYFRDVKKNESYYITNDWCVVKAILWWGGIFGKYNVKTEELKANIDNIFPEPQVYFGLIPIAFLGTYYPSNNFTTLTLKDYGYFNIDNPFKNIYGDNPPIPPKFINSLTAPLARLPSTATNAALLLDRMNFLQTNIFEKYVAKGACTTPEQYPQLRYACDYFFKRDYSFIPGKYSSFDKAIEFYTGPEQDY